MVDCVVMGSELSGGVRGYQKAGVLRQHLSRAGSGRLLGTSLLENEISSALVSCERCVDCGEYYPETYIMNFQAVWSHVLSKDCTAQVSLTRPHLEIAMLFQRPAISQGMDLISTDEQTRVWPIAQPFTWINLLGAGHLALAG